MNPRTNDIIGTIPDKELVYLQQHLKLVSLSSDQVLFATGQFPAHAYFPVGAIVSMMRDMPDGSSVETHMLGKLGMVGTGIGTTGVASFYRARVRSSGLAYKMDDPALRAAWGHCPALARNIQTSIQHILIQLAQAIVCGKKHSIEQQLIRWILQTLDNTLTDTIAITHQELSHLLGFRREAISLSMHKLAQNGSIQHSRGQFTVINRAELEMAVCACYRMTQAQTLRA